MKKLYQFNRFNSKRSPSWWRGGVTLMLVIFLILFGQFIFQPLLGLVFNLSSPILRANTKVSQELETVVGVISRSKKAVVEDNSKLRQRLIGLEAKLALVEDLVADNIELKRKLGLKTEDKISTLAQVVSNPWNSPFDILVASVSAPGLITTGSLVTYEGSLWLGEVVAIGGNSLKIRLNSAPGVDIPVRIGPENIPAQATGIGGGNLKVVLPRHLSVATGDWVYTANTPQPLIVGQVGEVEKDPGDSLQTVFLRLPINAYYLRYVEILN